MIIMGPDFDSLRPPHQNLEVKQGKPLLVLGWETTIEVKDAAMANHLGSSMGSQLDGTTGTLYYYVVYYR